MSPLTLILTIFLVLLIVGGLPAWGWHQHGYLPSSGIGLILLILIIVLFVRGG